MLVAELDAFGHEAGALVCKFWTEASVCTVSLSAMGNFEGYIKQNAFARLKRSLLLCLKWPLALPLLPVRTHAASYTMAAESRRTV